MVGGGLIDAAAAASLLEARASSFFSLWFNKAIFLKNEKEKESKKKRGVTETNTMLQLLHSFPIFHYSLFLCC